MTQTTAKPSLLFDDSEPFWEAQRTSCNRSRQANISVEGYKSISRKSFRGQLSREKLFFPILRTLFMHPRLKVELKKC